MFNVGDWVWGIDEWGESKRIVYLLLVGEADEYYFYIDYAHPKLNLKENVEELYHIYRCGCELFIGMIKKENTFATEQEAKEALEAMK